jgi:hypothetical protein
MIGWGNPNNNDIPSGCIDCDPGTYSTILIIGECPICPAGYVCLGGTELANPVLEVADKGYICQPGYYCPAGSYEMTACGLGTYNNSTLSTSISDCTSCPAQSYSSELATTVCQQCGDTSSSAAAATSCSCIGSNRKFLADLRQCICIDRYESATVSNTQVDSTEDCSRKLVNTCPDTTDTEGNCVSTTDSCGITCGTDGGTRVLGMCDCAAKTLTNAVCPSSCRTTRNIMTLSAIGEIYIETSGNVAVGTQSLTSLSIAGTVKYDSTSSSAIVSIGQNSNNSFTANYEASTALQADCATCNGARRNLYDGAKHRWLASSGSITNPVVCISAGDILMFDVSTPLLSYPVYVSNSLLNTNSAFDYGSFLSLATDIAAGTTYTYFMFQFTTSGLYVFENSVDSSQQMVVGVMGSGQKCPDSSEYISPISMKSMLLIGAAEASVVYEPDWIFIAGLLVGIMILIGFLIGVYYYLRRQWGIKYRRNVKYRRVNLKGELLPSIRADNRCFEYMQRNKDQRVANRVKQKMNREIRYSEIEDIRQRLKKHIDTLNGDLFWDGGANNSDTFSFQQNTIDKENIMLQLQKLKDLIIDHRKNIEGEFDEQYSDDEGDLGLLRRKGLSLKLMSNIVIKAKKMDHDIVGEGEKLDEDQLNKMMLQLQKRRDGVDKNMQGEYDRQMDEIRKRLAQRRKAGGSGDDAEDDDMRKKLMEELKEKLDNIDNGLKDEEIAQMSALEGKLAQRKNRRGLIVDDYAKIQQEKQDLIDNSILRKEIDKKIEEKYDEMEDELEKERDDGVRIIKENNNMMETFEDKLRNNADDKKNFDKHLDEYNRNRNRMQEQMRKEMTDQERQLTDELRKRRDARVAKIEAERGELMEGAKVEMKSKLQEIEEKEKNFEGFNANELDPFLKDIVKRSEQKVGNKRELDMIRAEADKALAKYRAAEANEREIIKQELLEKYRDDDRLHDDEVNGLRAQLLKEILDKEEEKESNLARLKREVEDAPTAEEKQRLLKEHDVCRNDMEDELKRLAKDGGELLEQRIRDRRAQRKKEEDDLLSERMREIDQSKQNDEDEQNRKVTDVRDDLEERTVEEIVRGLQLAIPKEEVPTALEKILDDRQMRELMELLMKQYEEKAQSMKDAVIDIVTQKADEIDALNKEVSESKSFIREAYEKGGITEEMMNDELKKIKARYDEKLNAINAKYDELEQEAQQKIIRDFAETHTNEQIALEEKHMRERERFFSKLLPESAMKRILSGMMSVEEEKLNDFIKYKHEERDARLREIEEKMAKFRLEVSNTQKELNDLDEYQRKLREKEIQAQRKFDIQQQRIIEQKRREQEAELTKVNSKEQREDMVKKHLEELKDLNRILGIERKRQIDIHALMFEEKRNAIEKRREELLEKRAEQEKLQQEKAEEEEKMKKEMTEMEKQRQENYLKLMHDNSSQLVLYDKPAYSTPIDWAYRRKLRKDTKATSLNEALRIGEGGKMTKEERVIRKLERIHDATKGPLTLELLARIMRLEEQVTELNEQ